jgi:hypothetical protein
MRVEESDSLAAELVSATVVPVGNCGSTWELVSVTGMKVEESGFLAGELVSAREVPVGGCGCT